MTTSSKSTNVKDIETPIGKTNGVKYLDIKEFREKGFLQEVNRQFFHPLGLALETTIDEETGGETLGGIWDYRLDPEGMVFAEGAIDQRKVESVMRLRASKRSTRFALFGSTIQRSQKREG